MVFTWNTVPWKEICLRESGKNNMKEIFTDFPLSGVRFTPNPNF